MEKPPVSIFTDLIMELCCKGNVPSWITSKLMIVQNTVLFRMTPLCFIDDEILIRLRPLNNKTLVAP